MTRLNLLCYEPSFNIKEIISLFSSFAALFITTYIAYQQYQIQKNKAKFDLFERRMKICDAIRNTLITIFRDASLKDHNLREEFYTSIRHSKFLFSDKELLSNIDDIERQVRGLEINNVKLYGEGALPVGDERDRVAEENSKILLSLSNQLTDFDKRFSDVMRISKI